MNAQRLTEIRERAAKATDGAWRATLDDPIRLIKSKKLEVYKVIEDLTRDVPQEVINFEWLWYEDRLDEIARDSLHHNFYISENFKSKDDVLLSRFRKHTNILAILIL